MDDTFYDGHDELYHHAKFGEDRTTRAGCRCENVVFVFFFVFTGRMPANCRYCFYSQAKNQVFRPAGATRCTDSGQTLQYRRAPGSAWLCKISRLSVQRGGNAARKYQKFPLFGKESPRRGDSLDQFQNFLGAFIRPTILRTGKCFKFHVIRITGYGVIAEKPRVGKLGQNFPCTL